MRNKDKPWFDDQCRHAFSLKQEAHLRWTRDRSRVNREEFVHCQVRANETYSEAKRQISARNRDVLAQSPHKWWSTLTSAVLRLSSSLPPLVSGGGGLVCESVGKADLLSDHFDRKQSRESVDLPLTCHLSLSLTSFVFRPSEVRRHLLDLDPYGGSYSLGMFHLFLKRTADVLAPRLSAVFRRLAGDKPMSPLFQKGPSSSSVANYRPISITSVLSKVFEHLVSVRLKQFMEHSVVLPTTQFAYQKSLGTCDALLCMSHTLQSALEGGLEARIVQIDFSTAFDSIINQFNHQGILYKLCSVGIGGSVLSVLTQFLSDRSQPVMVDGCWSKLVNVVSGVPQGSVLGPLLFPPYTSELFSILENKLIDYADDSTLIAVVPLALEWQ